VNTLYSFRRCPYAIRARMALKQAGIVFSLVEVSLRQKPQALLELSPKATVPVLHCADGRVLDQSLDIMHWALSQNDPAHWLDTADQPDNVTLLQANDGVFKHWLDRYKYFERYPERTQEAYRDEAVLSMVKPLERRLAQRPYLGGDTAGLTDVAIFPFVRQFAAVEPEWFAASPWTATRDWLSGWTQSDLFTVVMAKTPGKP